MKLVLVPTLGILFFSSVAVSDSVKEIGRQAPVFSANSYGEGTDGGQQVTVYDALNNKRPSESYTNSQQQGKSNFGLSSFASADSSSGYSNSFPAPAPSYIPQGPRPGQGSSSSGGYVESRPSVVVQQPQQTKPEETYAYYYQHYPSTQQQYGPPSTQGGLGSSHFGGLFDSDLFGGLSGGDLGGGGAALGGIGGLGALGLAGLAALAKGALALKPLLIFGVLLLVLLPLLILFLPIPIITIPTPTGRAGQLASAVTSLTQKVLGSEECMERIMCKIPPVPKKYQVQAKSLWTEYGPKVIKNGRLTRGLDAYFNSTDMEAKHRAFKCNQQFKCSNKFF